MKILWCDDLASDPAAIEAFRAEWGQTATPECVVPVTNDVEALMALRADLEIRLLVLDLLWDSQPEDPSVQPMGLQYLRRIRTEFPHLHTVTRSIAGTTKALAGWLSDMIELGVRDHFVSGDMLAQGQLRRRLLLENLERASAQRGVVTVPQVRDYIEDEFDLSREPVEPVWNQQEQTLAGDLRSTAWPRALQAVQRYAASRQSEAKGVRGPWFQSLHPTTEINAAAPFSQLPPLWEVVRGADKISPEVYTNEYGNDLTKDTWRLGNGLVLGFDRSAQGDGTRLQALIRLFLFHEYLHTYHSLTKYTAEEVGKFANCLERIDYGADLYALLHQIDFLVRTTELAATDPIALRHALVEQIDLILRSFWAFEPSDPSLDLWQVRRLRRYLNWYWRKAQLERTDSLDIAYRLLARAPTIELVGLKQQVSGRRHYVLLNQVDPRTDLELGLVMEHERMLRMPNSRSSRLGDLVEAFRSREHDEISTLMQRVFEAAQERGGALPRA
jgi:hypothetical protein